MSLGSQKNVLYSISIIGEKGKKEKQAKVYPNMKLK